MTDKQWSTYQQNIFDFISTGAGSTIVEAVAGSGKTTTIVEAMNLIPDGKEAIFLAFNRAIAEELRSRIPMRFEARTFNSLGYGVLRAKVKDLDLKSSKLYYLLKDHYPDLSEWHYGIQRLVSFAKQTPVPLDDWSLVIDDHGIDIPEEVESECILAAAHTLRRSNELVRPRGRIDFNDQVYIPILRSYDLPKFDYIFVDEAQDLNAVQHAWVIRMRHSDTRVIAVGDSKQAIYGFRGAQTSSMQTLRNLIDGDSLPLSISYRCPKSVVLAAQKLVPQIESSPTAEDGLVEFHDEMPKLNLFKPFDLIVCRTNAPILSLALKFLAQQLPIQILSDFDEQLKRFIKKFKTDDIKLFVAQLEDWYETESSKAELTERWGKLSHIEDQYQALLTLAHTDGVNTVEDLVALLELLFTPGAGPRLSTIHKAKGLEAIRTFILRPDLIPAKWAMRAGIPWMVEQESNLHYVAITRAQKELHYLPGGAM